MVQMEKIIEDDEFGAILLRKSARSRAISIRVRSRDARKGMPVIVTVPYFMRYQKGIDFLDSRRSWVRKALDSQEKKAAEARKDGRAVPILRDGSIVRTILSEIVFKTYTQQATVAIATNISGLDCGTATACHTDSNGLNQRPWLKIETEHIENMHDTGRLWLSLDRPITRKIVLFQNFSTDPESHDAGNQGEQDVNDTGRLSNENAIRHGSVSSDGRLTDTLIKILRNEAKQLLPQKLDLFAGRYGFSYRKLTIKHNSSNWGSCSRYGNINLNLNLIRLPEPLCDYVILHELCHLAEPNHGVRFHALLEKLCADHITRLISLGSPDALKYAAWISSQQDDSIAIHKSGIDPAPISSNCNLNLVLSREVSRWRMI